MSFTRRNWGREVAGVVAYLLSTLESKYENGKRRRGKLSAQRVILMTFVVQFARHWPSEWSSVWPVAAMGVLTFALVVERLFSDVPVREGLAALAAIAGAAVRRRAGAASPTVALPDTDTPEAA